MPPWLLAWLLAASTSLSCDPGWGSPKPESPHRLSDIAKIRPMGPPKRVTEPLLDVLEVLLWGLASGQAPHGWMIMKATKRTGPTVYGVLDRLEEAGWVEGTWEEQDSETSKPRRRLYRLTSSGTAGARALLAERRPQARRVHGAAKARPGFATFSGRLFQGGLL